MTGYFADVYTELQSRVPGLSELRRCPVCANWNIVMGLVTQLNDSHGWRREEIADWLDTLDVDMVIRHG